MLVCRRFLPNFLNIERTQDCLFYPVCRAGGMWTSSQYKKVKKDGQGIVCSVFIFNFFSDEIGDVVNYQYPSKQVLNRMNTNIIRQSRDT